MSAEGDGNLDKRAQYNSFEMPTDFQSFIKSLTKPYEDFQAAAASGWSTASDAAEDAEEEGAPATTEALENARRAFDSTANEYATLEEAMQDGQRVYTLMVAKKKNMQVLCAMESLLPGLDAALRRSADSGADEMAMADGQAMLGRLTGERDELVRSMKRRRELPSDYNSP